MKESYWGIAIILFAVTSLAVMFFFQNITNNDEHNYFLLKETTESAMIDAVDLGTYRSTGDIRIDRERFVESFVRRFAENANLSNEYVIEIYDINETPPKVSLLLKSKQSGSPTGEVVNFDITHRLDAILETTY
jgi:hypothetical protein